MTAIDAGSKRAPHGISAKRIYQYFVTLIALPYIRREMRGWGKVLQFVAGYKRDWLWSDAPEVTVRGRMFHNYEMRLALNGWADRWSYFLGRWYDLETQLILRDLVAPGSTVIDIGANRGMFALAASQAVGSDGRVICFEPNPNCQNIFDRDIAANNITNVTLHRCGLGEHDDELTLVVPFHNSGAGTFGAGLYDRDITYQAKVPVQIGDKILAGEKPVLIKIDVEGFERSVLAGLSTTIQKHHPIVLHEVAPAYLKASGSSLREISGLMKGHGYRGFRVGLERQNGKHTWTLHDLPDDDRDFDAAWFHSDTLRDRATILNTRLRSHG